MTLGVVRIDKRGAIARTDAKVVTRVEVGAIKFRWYSQKMFYGIWFRRQHQYASPQH